MKRTTILVAVFLLTWAAAARARAQDVPAALPAGVTVHKDIVYAKSGSAALKLDLYLPAGEKSKSGTPVIVRFAPHREAPARPAQELLAKGYALIYAGCLPDDAPPEKMFNRFPADLFAAKTAIRWVRGNAAANHLDPDRIGLWAAGQGASLAALLAMTAAQKDLAGTLGDFPDQSNAIRALCLFGGTTDWRNAELYGDETVNFPEDAGGAGSPAYQLFGGNVKEHPDDARRASAVTYIRPTSPPVLMITLASDSNRAMHLIFAETLQRAGVPSALYEEPPGSGAGLGGRAVDEAKLDHTILEFFADTLAPRREAAAPPTPQQQIEQLTKSGLYKQARQIIEEQVAEAAPGHRAPWLALARQVAEQQQKPALEKLAQAIKNYKTSTPIETRNSKLDNPFWTLREILTDPEHIGEYHVAADPSPRQYDARAHALAQVEILNGDVLQGDFAAADRQAASMRALVASGNADSDLTAEFLDRYANLRAHADQSWPPNVKPVVYALASGQDLYGFWFTMRAGGVVQRFRYVPPGNFAMGSPRTEWSRLPDEPILEPTQIKTGFWLADAPVTQDTWEGVMGKAENRSFFKGAKLPATNLSYAHAINFLAKLDVDARLPTAAQCEYACRAGSSDMYPVTGRLSDSAWFWDEQRPPAGSTGEALPAGDGDSATPAANAGRDQVRILTELETERSADGRATHPVRQKLPNRWGLYDMQGNVWQWCAGVSPNKPRDYHPAKGGSWISIPQSCRAARIVWFPIEQQSWNLGLRILIPAQTQ